MRSAVCRPMQTILIDNFFFQDYFYCMLLVTRPRFRCLWSMKIKTAHCFVENVRKVWNMSEISRQLCRFISACSIMLFVLVFWGVVRSLSFAGESFWISALKFLLCLFSWVMTFCKMIDLTVVLNNSTNQFVFVCD